MSRAMAIVLLVAVGVAAPACKKQKEAAPAPTATAPTAAPAAAVSVVNVTLGKGVGFDKKVTAQQDSFAPQDTIYASVDTQGAAPSATLSARWTYQDGQTVHEETQSIAPTGPATTEFHIAKPDGWPKGDYKVEILLDGTPVRSASFKVG